MPTSGFSPIVKPLTSADLDRIRAQIVATREHIRLQALILDRIHLKMALIEQGATDVSWVDSWGE